MSYNWKSRDVARITGLNTLQNVLSMAQSEEIELRDIADQWQSSGGILAFGDQIALIQRNAASRTHVNYFVYRLKILNRELFSQYPERGYLIKCILACIESFHSAIAESSHIREKLKNRAILTALSSGSITEGGEQYYLPYKRNEAEYEEEDKYEEIEPL